MDWNHAVATISRQVVKIETPDGYGTGFLSIPSRNGYFCGIATAAHVVAHADKWQQPIRIIFGASKASRLLTEDERVIFVDRATDSATVLFFPNDLELQQSLAPLRPIDRPCDIGADVGWLGYPAIEPETLCFFAGTVSARQADRSSYLIDGVAINGVSGGPVFHCPSPGAVQIIGSVSAYHANRATGEALPGLLRAQDVSHFHGVADFVRSLDEAREKKRRMEEMHRRQPPAVPPLEGVR